MYIDSGFDYIFLSDFLERSVLQWSSAGSVQDYEFPLVIKSDKSLPEGAYLRFRLTAIRLDNLITATQDYDVTVNVPPVAGDVTVRLALSCTGTLCP
jgi:hypothetical protein